MGAKFEVYQDNAGKQSVINAAKDRDDRRPDLDTTTAVVSSLPSRGRSPITHQFIGLPSPIVGRAGAGGHPCQGVYHSPSGQSPTTALIATHYNVDFSEHYLAEHMAARGFGFLGWNTRFRGAEPYFLLDHALAEIAVGVRWLRSRGIERVVLLGNSGGGSLMSAYHSQCREPNIRPARGRGVVSAALELPTADLFVFVAAHPGRPEILTDWLDPSVIDESDPTSRDPQLDMYDPCNGPPYSDEFITRYRAAQRDRNDRLTNWCIERLDHLQASGIGDQLFVMRRTWADPRFVDPAIDPSNRTTPRCYLGDPSEGQRRRVRDRHGQHVAHLAQHVEPA